jgi:ribosomal protein L40E
MSSETSTERHESLQPWQLFTLAGLLGATVVVFLSRGQSASAIILLSCAVFAAAYVGASALRTVLPLVGATREDVPEMLGDRTRAALEREKTLVLRSIKELEFDRGMGKVSEKDFAEMSARLRARAARLMRQLDAGSLYREQIEKEVAKRLAKTGVAGVAPASAKTPPANTCASCAAVNDPDARFCKNCGTQLGVRS